MDKNYKDVGIKIVKTPIPKICVCPTCGMEQPFVASQARAILLRKGKADALAGSDKKELHGDNYSLCNYFFTGRRKIPTHLCIYRTSFLNT